jgi:drug/metabolite transporter (DMT)-like permease
MLTQIVAKLAGEAMMSLYPMIVKLIDIPMHTQMWTRFISYAVFSSIFVDWGFIAKSVVSPQGWMLMLITLVHVYTSYEGFRYLESGMAYSVYYLYPIMLLLIAGEPISPWMFLALAGVIVLYFTPAKNETETVTDKTSSDTDKKWGRMRGYIMTLGAAFTEALIYFLVRNLPTPNSWNHIFLSYVLGAVGLSIYEYTQSAGIPVITGSIGLALGLNAFIGMFGYLLRFYAATRLPPSLYAPLSYFGVFMAYVYGLIAGTDLFSWVKVAATACILGANYAIVAKI